MRIKVPLTEKDGTCARSAAKWVGRFHPGVTAVVQADAIELECEAADKAQLVRLWNAALLNERSFDENGLRRRQLLRQLTR